MTVYLAFVAGLALGFIGHCAWSCLQADPGAVPPATNDVPGEIWPQDARLAVLHRPNDEHEELMQ
jgi:hypothetical protein